MICIITSLKMYKYIHSGATLKFVICAQNSVASKALASKVFHSHLKKGHPFFRAQVKSQHLIDAFADSFTKMSSL